MQFNNPSSTQETNPKNMITRHLRNSISQPPLRLAFLLIALALAWLALSPTAQAQLPSPSPDGGYPGNNTAKGDGDRLKQDIQAMGEASDALLALKPVTFRYKHAIDPDGIPQFGLVAEQVEKLNPALVARDADGKVFTVRYDAVNVMLLNEFLKEHGVVYEQGTTIAHLQKQIEALTAGLHKVSAQLEASKPAPQVVNNN